MRKRDLVEWIERGEVAPAPVRWQARAAGEPVTSVGDEL
jgi:hypothetical protein